MAGVALVVFIGGYYFIRGSRLAVVYVTESGCRAHKCKLTHSGAWDVLAFGWVGVLLLAAVAALAAIAVVVFTEVRLERHKWRPQSEAEAEYVRKSLAVARQAQEDAEQARREHERNELAERVRAAAALRQQQQVEQWQREQARKRTAEYIRAGLRSDGALRFRVFARDNYTCCTCGATGATAELTVDHITPVSLGGTNDEWNLQTLCRSCNSRKGARSI